VARPAHAASKPAVAWVLERIPELAGTTYQDGAKSREIELAGVLFLTYLADRSNTGNGRVWMTLATMSRETGLSGSHRDRLLRAFRSLGWLRQVGTTRENERGRGTPVYVLDLVPSLRALDEAYVARQAELVTPPGGISRPSPATDGAIYPPIVPPKSPPGGCENGENVNVSGANRENVNLYPYPNATDVTPEPPAVPPRTSVGEKTSLYHLVLHRVLDLEPQDAPERIKGARRTYLENIYAPILRELVAPHLEHPDTWDDTLASDLAHQALAERGLREAAPKRADIRDQVARAAKGEMSDTDLSRLIGTPEGCSPELLAVAQEHRPGFTWTPPQDVGRLLRDVAKGFRATG